jgi:hypothetical protein
LFFSIRKKESSLQDSSPAAGRGSNMLPLRRNAIIAFLPYGKKVSSALHEEPPVLPQFISFWRGNFL